MNTMDFKRKSMLRMAEGGPVGLRNLSFITEGDPNAVGLARYSPDQIARSAGFPQTPPLTDAQIAQPVQPQLGVGEQSSRTAINSSPVLSDALRPKLPAAAIGVRGARGGHVQGPGGPTEDKIHAMLSDGEYVLPAKTVAKIGVDNLDQMVEATNDGKVPSGLRTKRFSTGGADFYVNSDGVASRDPKLGEFNRQAVLQATPGAAAAAPPAAAPAAPPVAPPQVTPTVAGRIASGLRSFGTNLLKASAPAIVTNAAVSTGLTPTSEIDQRVQAVGLPSNSTMASNMENPMYRAAVSAVPFVGPMLGAAANIDPQLGADLVTRGAGAAMTALGLNGVADRRLAKSAIPAGPATADTAPQQTLRGSYTAPGQQSITQAAQAPAVAEISPADASRTQLGDEIAKIGRNPFKGIRGHNFYTGSGQQLASNVADELGQRAKVSALQAKYSTDVTDANAKAANKLANLQMQRDQANKNQEALKGTFDRLATIPTTDKDGNVTGTTTDPALRNRAEDFARSAVEGWDNLSPEQRAQGFEGVRHKFLLQELMNSGQANMLGKFMSFTGLSDQLGGYTAQPLKIKAVRTIGPGDLGQTSTSVLGIAGRSPYAEFENGKLYPLRDILNTPEVASAFEARLGQSSKEAQKQYLKYKGK